MFVLILNSCGWAVRKTLNLNKLHVYESNEDAYSFYQGLKISNSTLLFIDSTFEIIENDSPFSGKSLSLLSPHFFIFDSEGNYLNILEQPGSCSDSYIEKQISNGEIQLDSLRQMEGFVNLFALMQHLKTSNDNSVFMDSLKKADYYFLLPWNTIVAKRYKKAMKNIAQNIGMKHDIYFILISREFIKGENGIPPNYKHKARPKYKFGIDK